MKTDFIIQRITQNLTDNNGIKAYWEPGKELDGVITFNIQDHELKFIIEIKQEIRQYQLENIHLNNHKYKNYMIVAQRIFPEVKKQLRKQNIAYLEESGNLYLSKGEKLIWIDTNKMKPDSKSIGNRAFTKTGLKVLFQLLIKENLLNNTHRTIAETTHVALGNIPQVINGLKDTGFVLRLNKKELIWDNKKDLLERWMTEYETILKPAIFRGRFKFRTDWQKIKFEDNETLWGGEPAGDILTQYLRPEKFTIYTKESTNNLIRKYHLVPDKNGNVEVYDMFWENKETNKTVPYLLVYADLMSQNNKRCRETAKMIFDEYIQPNL
ncbi:MAG: type IV toxin-antitoxin system AbiEi family antitoxin [Labilibaculum antarcticum]